MGLVNWLKDTWLLMMRTKPQYISILGRKRSSIRSPPKLSPVEGKYAKIFGIFMCIVTMCCSISCGVLLLLSEGIAPSSLTTYIVSLGVAGIVAISGGLCLAEYISNQPQETPSIYSCCYQYSSEVLAFFIGWTWVVSQIAVISAICKILTVYLNDWSDDIPSKFLEKVFYNYAKDVPSLLFVLLFILFILTGFGETIVWFSFFVPLAFGMIAAVHIIGCVMDNPERSSVDILSLDDIKGIDEVLSISTVCILFFSGPQSLLRLPFTYIRKNTAAVLGPFNGIILIISFIFIMATSFLDKIVISSSPNDLLNLISNILCTISLCSVGIEAFYPLHYTIEDMSSDGMLFRSFSKKWKPFCFPVLSPTVHVLSFAAVGLMSVFMPLSDVLNLAVVFPLLVNSTVPYLVLLQRYSDDSSWQYEPMFHTAARSVVGDRSRKKSKEFQYSNAGFDNTDCEISTACVEENFSDTTSSDTDIDAVVQQYKDQTRVVNTATLDDPIRSSLTPEPTPTSAFRAKLCIVILIVISLIVSFTLNFANSKDHFSVVLIALLCALVSTFVQGFLICLPQNKKLEKSKGCCAKIPSMPWIPGMGSLLSSSLLVHSLMKTWKLSLGCFIAGALLYFLYGIRSSTAANSFYNMRATHITLRPLPSYGNNCIPQVIPSQRKMAKSRKHKRLKTGTL